MIENNEAIELDDDALEGVNGGYLSVSDDSVFNFGCEWSNGMCGTCSGCSGYMSWQGENGVQAWDCRYGHLNDNSNQKQF